MIERKIYPRIKMKECDPVEETCTIYVEHEDGILKGVVPYQLCDEVEVGGNVELIFQNGHLRFGSIPRKDGCPILMELV